MATEKKFLAKNMKDLLVKSYLEGELQNAGVSSINIQKTPLATRIAIRVKRPSLVIGKKGATVKAITEKLEKEFGIDNPQLDIIEVENPSLDAKLVAERIARQIEIEGNAKQIMRMNLRDVVESGAQGVELIVSGKVIGKGSKAKALRMRSGYLKKSGEVMRMVQEGKATAYLKAGAIGVTVKIVLPGTVFPDAVKIDYEKISLIGKEGEKAAIAEDGEKLDAERKAAEEAEKKMNEKIEKARRDQAAAALAKKKKLPKKKPLYEAENLIKSAESPAEHKAQLRVESAAGSTSATASTQGEGKAA